MRVAETNGKTTSLHLGCQIEDTERFHAVRRDCVLVVNDSDVAKAERLDQCLHDLMVRDRAVGFGC